MNRLALPQDLESRRYLLVAGVGAVVLLVLGYFSVAGGVLEVVRTGPLDYGGRAVPMRWYALSAVFSAVAPILAVRRPVPASLAALVLPLACLGLGVSLLSSLLAALVTAVVLQRRNPWLGVLVGVLALAVPGVVLVGGTMRLPTQNEIYLYPESSTEPLTLAIGYTVFIVLVLVAGLGFRTWVRGAEDRVRLAAARLEATNQTALVGERSRLARDLHDVVAHHVSLIAVRAETAPYTVEELSPGARAAFADIADDSRRALDELRGVLGVLQRSAGGEPELAPQPGVLDVAELVEHARQAGAVSFEGEDSLAVLDQARGYVVYRVVQEALTNARRHAAGQHVAVTCGPTPAGVWVEVTNADTSTGAVVPGRGLTGMRERVEAVGGTVDVRRVDGRFEVDVALPA